MIDQYSKHGTYSINIEDNTLIIEAKGPFNIELVTQYHVELLNSAELLAKRGHPWSQIIILHEESLFTPDAAQKLMESNCWRKTKGLSRSAVVLVNPVGASLITKQLNDIYNKSMIESAVFAEITAAKKWLAKFN